MILKNRIFKREPPSRDAKKIYIFCEGAKREYQYFKYFREIDSRIDICIYEISPEENNSPSGLFNIAQSCIINERTEKSCSFEFRKGDEVWLIYDLDPDKYNSRLGQIINNLEKCKEKKGWFTGLSNPCFEVWLYYHFRAQKPESDQIEKASTWKKILNETVPGGFDSRKHPIFLEDAQSNAGNNYDTENGIPKIGCTEVFKLSERIFSLLGRKLREALEQLDSE
jgi:hypothetical protein